MDNEIEIEYLRDILTSLNDINLILKTICLLVGLVIMFKIVHKFMGGGRH